MIYTDIHIRRDQQKCLQRIFDLGSGAQSAAPTMHKHLSNYFPWKTRVGKINQYWTNAIPVTKGPGYIGIHQEKKEKEDLLLLSWKISPRPRNQNKKLRNHNKTRMVKFWSGSTFTNMYFHTLQGLVVAAVTLNPFSKLSSTPFLSVADIFLFLF